MSVDMLDSELYKMFDKLSIRSQEAIINENEFDDYKTYMHIKRPIEEDFEKAIQKHLIPKNKSIIFLVGNVGDGKSHLLSYMTSKYMKDIEDYKVVVHNDATETTSPNKTAIETLLNLFYPFNDSNLNNGEEDRLIVAINLGVLTNFVDELSNHSEYTILKNFILESNVLDSHNVEKIENEYFKIVSFIGQSNIEIIDNKIGSNFYKRAMQKVFSTKEENPYFQAYLNDINSGRIDYIHKNYELLLRNDVKEAIVNLLLRAEIEYKTLISARSLFNLFYDITVPNPNITNNKKSLPYLLFENVNKSELLSIIAEFDPIKNQTKKIDDISIKLYHAQDYMEKTMELLGEENSFNYVFSGLKNKKSDFKEYLNSYIRICYLLNYNSDIFDFSIYNEFIDIIVNIKSGKLERRILDLVKNNYYKWNGDIGDKNKIIKNPSDSKIKLLIASDFKSKKQMVVGANIVLSIEINNRLIDVAIDYNTFVLLKKLESGYFLKGIDKQKAINFDQFITEIIRVSEEDSSDVYLYNVETKDKYILSKDTMELNDNVIEDYSIKRM